MDVVVAPLVPGCCAAGDTDQLGVADGRGGRGRGRYVSTAASLCSAADGSRKGDSSIETRTFRSADDAAMARRVVVVRQSRPKITKWRGGRSLSHLDLAEPHCLAWFAPGPAWTLPPGGGQRFATHHHRGYISSSVPAPSCPHCRRPLDTRRPGRHGAWNAAESMARRALPNQPGRFLALITLSAVLLLLRAHSPMSRRNSRRMLSLLDDTGGGASSRSRPSLRWRLMVKHRLNVVRAARRLQNASYSS